MTGGTKGGAQRARTLKPSCDGVAISNLPSTIHQMCFLEGKGSRSVRLTALTLSHFDYSDNSWGANLVEHKGPAQDRYELALHLLHSECTIDVPYRLVVLAWLRQLSDKYKTFKNPVRTAL
jgi:hypothetical protein